jgi:hypothetical protein
MGQVRALAAAITLCAVACAGCSAAAPRRSVHVVSPTRASQAPVVTSPADCGTGGIAARPRKPGRARLWPERLVARDSPGSVAQALDPVTGVVYTLVGRSANGSPAPYALACTSLRTGAVQRGPVFQASGPPFVHGFAIASAYLWVSLTLSQPVVRQVDLRDLAVVRSLRLPRANPTCDLGVTVAAGPANSVWIGSYHTLLRMDTATGVIMARATLPPGVAISDIAVDPARRHLYVSVASVVRGGCERNAVFEYGARTGRRLAAATRGPITYSVVGSWLTAVPGGVWASFRTGMLGLTLHLRQRDLAMIAPPSARTLLRAPHSLFHWAMTATTLYGAGALWISTLEFMACLDPRTGTTRAIERIPQSGGAPQPVATDRSSHQLFALGPDGLVQITPPHRCWR